MLTKLKSSLVASLILKNPHQNCMISNLAVIHNMPQITIVAFKSILDSLRMSLRWQRAKKIPYSAIRKKEALTILHNTYPLKLRSFLWMKSWLNLIRKPGLIWAAARTITKTAKSTSLFRYSIERTNLLAMLNPQAPKKVHWSLQWNNNRKIYYS